MALEIKMADGMGPDRYFCASVHDTYAYRISFLYVHVGIVIIIYEAYFLCPVGGAMDMTQY